MARSSHASIVAAGRVLLLVMQELGPARMINIGGVLNAAGGTTKDHARIDASLVALADPISFRAISFALMHKQL